MAMNTGDDGASAEVDPNALQYQEILFSLGMSVVAVLAGAPQRPRLRADAAAITALRAGIS